MFPPPSRSLLARPEVHDSLRGRRIKGQAGRARDGHLALALGQRRAKAGAAERLRLRQVLPPVGVFIFPADYVFNTVQDPTCLRFNSRFNCQSAFRQGSMCYCAASPLLFFFPLFFPLFFLLDTGRRIRTARSFLRRKMRRAMAGVPSPRPLPPVLFHPSKVSMRPESSSRRHCYYSSNVGFHY